MERMPLSLNPESEGSEQPPPEPTTAPVMGWFAVGFGLLGIFTIGFIFVPLALICSVIAIFLGQGTWGFIGLLLVVGGFLTSPKLWLFVGISAVSFMVDWQDLIQPFLDLFDGGGGSGTKEV